MSSSVNPPRIYTYKPAENPSSVPTLKQLQYKQIPSEKDLHFLQISSDRNFHDLILARSKAWLALDKWSGCFVKAVNTEPVYELSQVSGPDCYQCGQTIMLYRLM